MAARRHRLDIAIDYALELLSTGQPFAAAEVLRIARDDERRVEHGLPALAPSVLHLKGHAECRLHEVRMAARLSDIRPYLRAVAPAVRPVSLKRPRRGDLG